MLRYYASHFGSLCPVLALRCRHAAVNEDRMKNVIGLIFCGLCIYWAADWAANRESGTAAGSGGAAPTSEVAKLTSKHGAPLIKLGGRLGRRREYDFWLITNWVNVLNRQSREMMLLRSEERRVGKECR